MVILSNTESKFYQKRSLQGQLERLKMQLVFDSSEERMKSPKGAHKTDP